jgi:hypothetical protein
LIEHAAAKEVEECLLRTSNALYETHHCWDLLGWARPGREIQRVFTNVFYPIHEWVDPINEYTPL